MLPNFCPSPVPQFWIRSKSGRDTICFQLWGGNKHLFQATADKLEVMPPGNCTRRVHFICKDLIFTEIPEASILTGLFFALCPAVHTADEWPAIPHSDSMVCLKMLKKNVYCSRKTVLSQMTVAFY